MGTPRTGDSFHGQRRGSRHLRRGRVTSRWSVSSDGTGPGYAHGDEYGDAMNTSEDTGVPLLECSRVEGWHELAAYLSSLGIEVTADALQARRRRHQIPIRGGGVKGRLVYFTTPELDAWMQHLQGCSLREWLEFQQGRRLDDLGLHSGPPKRSTETACLPLPPFDLYAATSRWPVDPEYLLRADNGYLHAAQDPAVFQDAAAKACDDFRHWRAWRYYGMRRATATDLRGPSPRWKVRARTRAGRLVGAVLRRSGVLRWCKLPGPHCGLPEGVTTPFLLAWSWPELRAAVEWIKRHEPEALLLAWPRREELEPVMLEELPQGEQHFRVDRLAR